MTFQQVWDTPIKEFWIINRNINRLVAEERLLTMDVMAAAMSGTKETYQAARADLLNEMGEVVKQNSEYVDPDGIETLRRLSKV